MKQNVVGRDNWRREVGVSGKWSRSLRRGKHNLQEKVRGVKRSIKDEVKGRG